MNPSFNITPRTLMGPGPSDVHPRILSALAKPTIGHLDPQFIQLMDEIKAMLKYAFQTKNELTMPISAPGSAGMETCFVNLVEPGDKVVVCINGVFGKRMQENVERLGGQAIIVEDAWGTAVDPHKVEEALKAHADAKILAFVHAETSTGALSDAATLCNLAHTYGCLTLVDAVTSLAGVPVKVDEWGIDAIYSGTQKCLSCIPGMSPISLSTAALEKIKNRQSKISSWFFDINLIMAYWGEDSHANAPRAYHHTAPVNNLYALHEALVMLQEEGLEQAWHRHYTNHILLRDALNKLGIEFVVQEDQRLPQLNSVWVPSDVDDAYIRKQLLSQYDIEIGAGLGALAGKVWRIGLMGSASTPKNVITLTGALQALLGEY